jgi:hypothetical protein
MSFNEVYQDTRKDMRRFIHPLDRLHEIFDMSSDSSDSSEEPPILDIRSMNEMSMYDWLKFYYYKFLFFISPPYNI